MNNEEYPDQIAVFKGFKVTKVYHKTWQINDHNIDYVYLLEGEDKSLVIDTGIGIGNLKNIILSLTDRPLIVVNTHGHVDHASGNPNFKKIYANIEDFDLIRQHCSGRLRKLFFEHGRVSKSLIVEGLVEQRDYKLTPVKDGFTFELGNRTVKVISLPGHSQGSICLLDVKHRTLFSGDSIVAGPVLIYKSPYLNSTTVKTFLDGLTRLAKQSNMFNIIYPSHHKIPISNEYLSELIDACMDLINGKGRGEPFVDSIFGSGLLYQKGRGIIAYSKDRII